MTGSAGPCTVVACASASQLSSNTPLPDAIAPTSRLTLMPVMQCGAQPYRDEACSNGAPRTQRSGLMEQIRG